MLGRMDLRQRINRVQTAFPDARYEVVDYLVQGPTVAWRWMIRGTHTKEILGVRPTGRLVMLAGLSMALVHRGKAIEHWEFADIPQLVAQLQGSS